MSSADLELALSLADAADAISVGHFGNPSMVVELKADQTPVTLTDRTIEALVRARLTAERPADAVVGEEYGATGDAPRRWFVDPIDGTRNFSRGVPVWATLLSLHDQSGPQVAVVSAPALHRRWWAARDQGAWRDGAAISASPVQQLAEAHLSCSDPRDFAEQGWGQGFEVLISQVRSVRAFGDFWSHMMVAEGAIDVAIEAVVDPWDLAPLQLIVEEAGGRFTDFRGMARIDGGNAISSNGELHHQVLSVMRTRSPR